MYVTLCKNCKCYDGNAVNPCAVGRLLVFATRGEVQTTDDGDFVVQRICNAFVKKETDVTIDQIKEALRFEFTLILQGNDIEDIKTKYYKALPELPKEVVVCTTIKNVSWIKEFPSSTRFEFHTDDHLTWPKIKTKHAYFVGENDKISGEFMSRFIKSLNVDLDYLIYREYSPTAFIFNYNTYTKVKSIESMKAIQNEKECNNNNLPQELREVSEERSE